MISGLLRTNGRALAWIGFFSVILLAWAALFVMARGGADWLCGPDVIRALPMGGFAALFPMWLVMSAAMMLPTIVPTLRAYQNLPSRTGASGAGWWALVGGYATIWGATSVLFSALQALALSYGYLNISGVLTSPILAAGLLFLAGVWQFTRGKEICQTACLSPMSYFTGRFQPGLSGGFAMGVEIGLTCVGCCWAIMALAFVGGMTSLWFMGLATAFMVAEKLPEFGLRLRKPMGLILLLLGLLVLLRSGHYAG